MQFLIQHHTHYRYSCPVRLGLQELRFYPRDDGMQRTLEHRITVNPAPSGRNEHLDLEGNRVTQLWFEGETEDLDIHVEMRVETLRDNAYDFILNFGAMELPVEYDQDTGLANVYLERSDPDPSVTEFARAVDQAAQNETLCFLNALTGRLYADFSHVHRQSGDPQRPVSTLINRSGACRDLALLFVDCCRARGIAARFASGYHRGDLEKDRRHLHAWPEVYLPGAGWRGFDPTQGHAIADTHVTIAASANPRNTLPVSGNFIGLGASSTLEYAVNIRVE